MIIILSSCSLYTLGGDPPGRGRSLGLSRWSSHYTRPEGIIYSSSYIVPLLHSSFHCIIPFLVKEFVVKKLTLQVMISVFCVVSKLLFRMAQLNGSTSSGKKNVWTMWVAKCFLMLFNTIFVILMVIDMVCAVSEFSSKFEVYSNHLFKDINIYNVSAMYQNSSFIASWFHVTNRN